MPTLAANSQIIADAYKLYLSFGGLHHREIEAAMSAGGYPTFSRRVFYDRKERGKIYPGWIRKFRWNDPHELPALRRRGGSRCLLSADGVVLSSPEISS